MEDASSSSRLRLSRFLNCLLPVTLVPTLFPAFVVGTGRRGLATLVADTKNLDLTAIVGGMPAMYNNRLYNVAFRSFRVDICWELCPKPLR